MSKEDTDHKSSGLASTCFGMVKAYENKPKTEDTSKGSLPSAGDESTEGAAKDTVEVSKYLEAFQKSLTKGTQFSGRYGWPWEVKAGESMEGAAKDTVEVSKYWEAFQKSFAKAIESDQNIVTDESMEGAAKDTVEVSKYSEAFQKSFTKGTQISGIYGWPWEAYKYQKSEEDVAKEDSCNTGN
ncbi:hypothetical protein A2U01_0001122 [Trifolium medium]|uniref:Uncharacterized protein n=1 Tax=Trifolium medium TaxID=97028 RepID=A0A392LZF3_9FABA|nr:hypothetical protein [Trifolium medium]